MTAEQLARQRFNKRREVPEISKRSLYPRVSKTLFADILNAKGTADEWNQEVFHSIKGLTYLSNAIVQLKAVKRVAKDFNVEYADKLSHVVGLMESAKKEWPLIVEGK